METKGLIQIYCGDGKGKTTASVGALIRAAGYGGRCMFFQFLKDNSSGERCVLKQIDGIDVIDGPDELGKVWNFGSEEIKKLAVYYEEKFEELKRIIKSTDYDVIVLDEINVAVEYGYIKKETVIDFLKNKPYGTEVILTGRNPDKDFINIADYVSHINKVKHPFDKGIKARKMIEGGVAN